MAVLASGARPAAAGETSAYAVKVSLQQLHTTNQRIGLYHRATCHWQNLMGWSCTRSSYQPEQVRSMAYAAWVLKLWKGRARRQHNLARHWMERRTTVFRSSVEHWLKAMGRNPIRDLADSSSIEAQFNLWRRTAKSVRSQFQNPPHKADFLCIHRYEAGWHDRDSGSNGHYGGVQFGKHEWLTFGYPYTGKLWAYQATMMEQLWAAERYWKVSGFYPWPQTAHDCGLL